MNLDEILEIKKGTDEFKTIGNIWTRGKEQDSTEAKSISIDNTRKAVNLTNSPDMLNVISYYKNSVELKNTFNSLIVGETYTMSCNYKIAGIGSGRANNFRYYENGIWHTESTCRGNVEGNRVSWTFTATEEMVNMTTARFYFGDYEVGEGYVKDIQLEKGSTASAYYPYFASTKVMPNLKAYGSQVQEVQPKLWGRYKPVEYINNSSTGYMITDLYPSGTDKIYVKASTTGSLTANQGLFGNYHDGGSTKDFVGYFGKDHFYIWRNGVQQNFVAKPQANVIYEFTADYLNGSATVKGDSVDETITFTPTTFTCDNKLPIGARHNASYGGVFAYNFYSVKYYRNNELIGDYVPVKDTVDNVYGMYDRVNNKFYGNAGTGAFTGGDEIKIVDYLTSDGNQYIDLGFIPTGDNWELDVKWDATSDEITKRTVLGSQKSQAILTIYSANFYCSGDGVDVENRIKPMAFGKGINTANIKGNNHLVTPNVSTGTYASYSANTNMSGLNGNMYLFKNNNPSSTQILVGSIYYFKWKQNNVLVREMIPIKLGTEYGMFDLVEWKVYRNAGTGSFTGGSEIPYRLFKPYDLISNKGKISWNGTNLVADGEHNIYWASKNLAPWWTWETGTISTSTGVEQENINRIRSDFIPVKHLIYATSTSLRIRNGMLYDKNKNFIKASVYPRTTDGILNLTEQPDNMVYIRIVYSFQEDAPMTPLDMKNDHYQLEVGNTITAYEDNKVDINDIIPSATSYTDIQQGKLYKDWGIKVFDGTEGWARHNSYPLFTLNDSTITATADIIACQSNYYIGLTPKIGAGSVHDDEIKAGYISGTTITKLFYVRDDRYTEVNDWKAHLKELYDSGKPVICVYPLANPTTTDITTQPISLTTKGQKNILAEAELDTKVKATYLGK